MKYLFFVFLVFMFSPIINAQHLSAFVDPQEAFHVFDDGAIRKIEFLPVKSYQVGHQYVAYVDNSGRFKIYFNGLIKDLYETEPAHYFATDYLLVYESNHILKVLEQGYPKTIATQVNRQYLVSDSLVAFKNDIGIFEIYLAGKTFELEGMWPKAIKIAGNQCAYISHLGELKLFKNGKAVVVETVAPFDFKIGNNMLAYIDVMGQLVAYHNNTYYELMPYIPEYFNVGSDMVVYIDGLEACRVFYKGKDLELLPYPPVHLRIEDEIVYFEDERGYSYVFFEGEVIQISAHPIEHFKIHRGIFAFTDLDGRLHALIKGELFDVSTGIVEARFRIDGEVIRYIENTNQVKFYYTGNTF